MSVLLLESEGCLGQAVEAVLRLNLNRENMEWWRSAAHISLAHWPSYRDDQIKEIFNSLEWLPIWELPDGEYTVRKGMGRTVAVKNGDRISFYNISASLRRYDLEEIWRRGEPCPYAYSMQDISAAWDERVKEWRLLVVRERVPDTYVWSWAPEEQEAARRVLELAHEERWEEALEVIQACPFSYLLKEYLRGLCGAGHRSVQRDGERVQPEVAPQGLAP